MAKGCEPTRNAIIVKIAIILLIAQRNHGIYAHGAPRWDVTGDQSNYREEEGDSRKGERIGGADSIKKARHQPGKSIGSYEPDGDSGQRHAHTLPKDHPQDVLMKRAERHAHTNLLGTVGNGIGDHTIHPNGSNEECESAKGTQEDGLETPVNHGR